MKEDYIKDLVQAIKKLPMFEGRNMIIQCVENNLRKFLCDDSDGEWLTTQSLIRLNHLFRGWIMINLLDIQEFQTIGMRKVNKIIIKKSVEFYSLAWKQRNEVFHNEVKQK